MIDLADRTNSKPQPAETMRAAQRSSLLTRIMRSIRKNGTLFLMALPGMALLFVYLHATAQGQPADGRGSWRTWASGW